jgi:ubiquitin carboxyl-terminal hydrolase 4/11/15
MVAKAYALLLNDLFSPNATSSFAPRNFKNVIGKYGPSFSGYQQQDSQEFLLFLLDGLQEDLSRVHKKPYIEKPDSTDEMVSDPVALRVMADKCWEIYKARNDSVITDLFAGMYKSTVVCPVCDKVSIIFDPFNNLTLQLPLESVWSKEVFFFPLHSRPIKVGVDIEKNASFMALKEYVAGKVGVDPKKTLVGEIYKSRIYKMYEDNKTIGEERIAEGDIIAIFELEAVPSNYPPPKKKVQKYKQLQYYHNSDEEEDVPEGESPLADKMLVPVFNRQVKEGNSRFQQRTIFGVPSYIILTRDEANDYDSILRKVLAKVATMTTRDIFNDEGESRHDSGPEDSDTVLMNADDGESSSDSRIQADSLKSEDGMINISMKGDGEATTQVSSGLLDPIPELKTALPKMLQPGEFITPEVRMLFEMKYFASNEMIPTGWSTLQDESKEYPTIQSRCPDPEAPRRQISKGKTARRLQRLGSASSSEAEGDNVDVPDQAPGLPIGYDSDSDGLPDVEQVTRAPRSLAIVNNKLRRNSKSIITYSRKGKTVASNSQHEETESEAHRNPLIRLGEAIVLDWTPQAFDALFSGYDSLQDNGMRGAATWEEIPLIADPELEKRRKMRIDRKKNGISLEDCLDEFGKPEVLSENDAWYCPRCKEHRRASKTFELWKAPDILVIHLKRFSAQGRNLRDKLDVLVDFPVEGLDLSSRVVMQEDGKSPIYDLFAVDNHYGGLGGGHYTAFAQNFNDKMWYEYNGGSQINSLLK